METFVVAILLRFSKGTGISDIDRYRLIDKFGDKCLRWSLNRIGWGKSK